MADFVGIAASTTSPATGGLISKGTRFVSPSRDMFYNTPNNSFTFSMGPSGSGYPAEGSYIYTGIGSTSLGRLPFFGVNAEVAKYSSRTILLIDSETSETGVTNTSSPQGNWNNHSYKTTNLTPGTYTLNHKPNGNNHWNHGGTWIASPIHTSSHYQAFETPFLNELVGGDRNMEQTNLVVTPDGKSWDEVTRDTSYIGSLRVRASHNQHYTGESDLHIFDEWRGNTDGVYSLLNKDFAIAYDRVICLVPGEYQIQTHQIANNQDRRIATIQINGTTVLESYTYHATGNNAHNTMVTLQLKRGDYVQIRGPGSDYNEWCTLEIIRT